MSNDVAERPTNRSVAVRPMIDGETLKMEAEQRKLLGEYVKDQMDEGTDYGVIPGTKSKTLLKPGAEKLASLFRCTPRFEIVEKTEDWDAMLFHYQFRCFIETNANGAVVAEGFGSANSREGKWRWRQSNRKCPNCGKEAIIKGKADYGGGWLCFAKKGGCGAKWEDGSSEIESQEVGRVENDDVGTLVNTILKIAKKRALVDASIALTRCSDLFTQDVEDTHDDNQTIPSKPATKREPAKQSAPKVEPVSESELVKILAIHTDAIEAAQSLEELKAVWGIIDRDKRLPVDSKSDLCDLKNFRKTALAEPPSIGEPPLRKPEPQDVSAMR